MEVRGSGFEDRGERILASVPPRVRRPARRVPSGGLPETYRGGAGSEDRGASWAVWGKGRVAGVSYLAGLSTRVTTTWLTSIAAHPLGARLGMDQSGRIIGPSPDRGGDGLKRCFLL